MLNRRRFLSRSGVALMGTAGTCFAFSGDNADTREALPDGSASRGMITSATDTAINKGLEYLASVYRQNQNGNFGSGLLKPGHVAVTSLAGLAFMAAGNQPNRGTYGPIVTACIRSILENTKRNNDPPGFLYNPNTFIMGPMYSHGFGTLFLAEVSGMIHDKTLRVAVNKKVHEAVQIIVKSQNREGGWRYQPIKDDADLSVTVCQMMALRSARNAGIAVDPQVVQKCIEYVKRCQIKEDGHFRYQLNGPPGLNTPESFARTAAGVSALNSAGIYLKNAEGGINTEVSKGLDFLQRNQPMPLNAMQTNGVEKMHYFYGHYYAVQAMWTAGGDYWAKWYPHIRDELLQRREVNGSWDDTICAHYATAMACLILQVPNNYLPILQK